MSVQSEKVLAAQVGWWNEADGVFLSMEEVEEFGFCYPPLKPVVTLDGAQSRADRNEQKGDDERPE